MINYWTIMIEKSDKTANLQTLNYNIGHLDKFTEARRKYLLNVIIVTLVVNQTVKLMYNLHQNSSVL